MGKIVGALGIGILVGLLIGGFGRDLVGERGKSDGSPNSELVNSTPDPYPASDLESSAFRSIALDLAFSDSANSVSGQSVKIYRIVKWLLLMYLQNGSHANMGQGVETILAEALYRKLSQDELERYAFSFLNQIERVNYSAHTVCYDSTGQTTMVITKRAYLLLNYVTNEEIVDSKKLASDFAAFVFEELPERNPDLADMLRAIRR